MPFPDILARYQAAKQAVKSLHARFIQETHNASRSVAQSGQFWVRQPSEYRWDYEKPQIKHYILSHGYYWQIVPDEDVTTGGRLPQRGGLGFLDLLTGDTVLLKKFSFERLTLPNLGRPGDILLKVTPRAQDSELRYVYAVLDPGTLLLREAYLYRFDGSSEHWTLSNITVNPQTGIDDALFQPPIPEREAPQFVESMDTQSLPWLAFGTDVASNMRPSGRLPKYLAVGPTGALWLATERGLSRQSDGTFFHYGLTNGLPDEQILSIVATESGLFAATPRGLVYIEDPPIQRPQTLLTGFVQVALRQDDRLWFLVKNSSGSQLGCLKLEDTGRPGRLELFPRQYPLLRSMLPGPGSSKRDRLLVEDARAIWHEVSVNGSKPGPLSDARAWSRVKPFSAVSTPRGTLYLGSDGTLRGELDGRHLQELLFGTSMTSPVMQLSRDNGRLWIGLSGAIYELDIDRLAQRGSSVQDAILRMLKLPSSTQLQSDANDLRRGQARREVSAGAIAEDDAGRLWVATSAGLAMTDQRRAWLAPWTNPQASSLPVVLEETEQGGRSKSLLQTLPGEGLFEEPQDRDVSKPAAAAGFTSQGDVWIGAANRLVVYDLDGKLGRSEPHRSAELHTPGLPTSVDLGPPMRLVSDAGLVWPQPDKNQGPTSWERLIEAPHADLRRLLVRAARREHRQGEFTYESSDLSRLFAMPVARQRLQANFSLPELKTWDRQDQLLDALAKRFGSAALKGWPWVSYRIAAAFEDATVVLPEPAGGPGHYPLFMRGQGDSRRVEELSSVLHVPSVSSVVREPASGDWLVLSAADAQLYVGKQDGKALSALALPESGGKEVRLDHLFVSEGSSGRAVVSGTEGAWQRSDDGWKRIVRTGARPPQVVALLPDAAGGGAIVGCRGCAGGSVFRLESDGRAVSLDLALPARSNGGILQRDSRGREWIASAQGLQMRRGHNTRFSQVLKQDGTPLLAHITAFLEAPNGSVYLGGAGGVWRYREGEPLRQILNVTNEITALSIVTRPGGAELWIGGDEFLRAIDLATEKVRLDYLDAVRATLGITVSLGAVRGLLVDGDGVLVLTPFGLVRIGGAVGTAERVLLTSWTTDERAHDSLTLTRLRSGALVITSHEEIDVGSRIWVRKPGDRDFALMAGQGPLVNTVAETQNGQVFFGAAANRLLTLSSDLHVMPLARWNLPQFVGPEEVPQPIFSVCPLRDGSMLVLPGDLLPVKVREGAPSERLNLILPPFTDCAQLGDSRYVMLTRESGVELSLAERDGAVAALRFEDGPPRLLHALQHRTLAGDRDDVVLLSDQALLRFDSTAGVFRRIAELPAELRKSLWSAHLAFDDTGFWIGAWGSGLWRLPLDVQGDQKGGPASSAAPAKSARTGRRGLWQSFTEAEGLRSEAIEGVSVVGANRVIVWSQAGLTYGTRAVDGSWRFEAVSQLGIRGQVVRGAELFMLDGKGVLALATDEGVSIVPYDKDVGRVQDSGRWTQLGRSNGLLSEDVWSVKWLPARKELAVGTALGLALFRLGVRDGAVAAELTDTLTESGGLPRGPVRAISTDQMAQNIWFLVERSESFGRLANSFEMGRWNRAQGTVTSGESFLLSQVTAVRLGPSRDGKAPRVLLQDLEGSWSCWSPAAYLRPRLTGESPLLFLRAELQAGSLEPADDNFAGWEVRYGMDGLTTASPSPLFLPRDLWSRPERHTLFAELSRIEEGHRVRFVAVQLLEPLKAEYWIGRLVAILLAFSGLVGWMGYSLRKRIIRRGRLRAREIPYIQGGAVQDPDAFFGRQALLARLRNTLASANYALTGEFRIGKTSIQHQLTQLLRKVEDKKRIYLPLFIDLQHLGRSRSAGARFFYFLGGHLVRLAKDEGVAQEVLDSLGRATLPPDAYDSMEIEADVQKVLTALKARYAPRLPIIVLQLDELVVMEDFDADVRLGLRALFVHSQQLRCVLTGHRLLKDSADVSPWWNFLNEIPIEPLTRAEAQTLVVEPARELFTYSREAIEFLCAQAAGRPLALQRLCANVLQYKYDSGHLRRRITLADVQAALRPRAAQPDAQPKNESEPSS